MNEKDISGVRVYIVTVDSETNTVLKTEEVDPKTGQRTDLALSFQAVPAQQPVAQTAIPAGFVPSIVILLGGQSVVGPASVMSTPQTRDWFPPNVPTNPPRGAPPRPQTREWIPIDIPINLPRGGVPPPEPSQSPEPSQKSAEDEKTDKGGAPKV